MRRILSFDGRTYVLPAGTTARAATTLRNLLGQAQKVRVFAVEGTNHFEPVEAVEAQVEGVEDERLVPRRERLQQLRGQR